MNLTFVFWLSAFYTLVLFGLQLTELLSGGRIHFSLTVLNSFYLALLSVYVGGKETKRWKDDAPEEPQRAFRLSGEWFVGLWAIFLPAAVILPQLWPGRFAYPDGLTLIALEVLGFYIGSSASKWLNETKLHASAQAELETDGNGPPAAKPTPRVQQRILRFEERVLAAARVQGSMTREQIEGLLKISRSAAQRLLMRMVQSGSLRRDGEPTSPNAVYRTV